MSDWRPQLLRLLDGAEIFKTRWYLNAPLALGNLVAVYWGWSYYYAGQLAATSPALRPFVPDSPNAVLAFALALALALAKIRHPLLDLVAWVLNIKVGLWTVVVLLYYYDHFFSEDAVLRWFLFWLHVGMVGQAFVLHASLRRHPLPLWVFVAVAGFVLLGDGLDYGIPIHPILPTCGEGSCLPGTEGYGFPRVIALLTVALSLATLVWAAILYRPGAPRQDWPRRGNKD